MILGQVSWLDCFVFLIFLAPQLIIHVGFFPTLFCGLRALPFLLVKLPLGFLYDHLLVSQQNRSPFVQQASWFEDIVIRCVRYAFAYIPAKIGKVFFSKYVALPFLRFRMSRHGYVRSPIHWQEVKERDFEGIWIIADPTRKPDVVIYYAHGGGFSMGSSYFYLEFLLAFVTLLKASPKFSNPAILALEYTLVPTASYPTQLHQAIAGYKYLLNISPPSQIVFSGDSAGATIILSLLLHIGQNPKKALKNGTIAINTHLNSKIDNIAGMNPRFAVLLSPWTTLHTPLHKATSSDYLSPPVLQEYALQYVSQSRTRLSDPLVSPGNCLDATWWRNASPAKGFFFSYGREEVFAPSIKELITTLGKVGADVEGVEEKGGVHAWVVVGLFLGVGEGRLRGLRGVVRAIERAFD